MPHDGQLDGQDMKPTTPLLPDLLALTQSALAPLDQLLEIATSRVRETVSDGGRVSGALVEQHQYAAHGLAWLALGRKAGVGALRACFPPRMFPRFSPLTI